MTQKQKKVIKPVVKGFNCKSCGAAVSVTAVGLTVSVVCPSCHATIDANDENFRIIKKAQNMKEVSPLIPIGTRGTFSGKTYEVIGFMQRNDGPYYWCEYLLFNPYHGFRWLFEMDGHWNFIKRVRNVKEDGLKPSIVKYKGKNFKLFNKGEAKVNYVEGEFYWRVKKGEQTRVKDYIAPPHMVSVESGNGERIWTMGTYMEPERIAKNFKLKTELPEPYGIAPNQPSELKKRFREVAKYFTAALLAVLFIFVVRLITADNEMVFEQTVEVREKKGVPGKKFEMIKTSPFIIDADHKNLKVIGYANLMNAWVYMDILLVDTKTGQGISIPFELSYYYSYGESYGSKTTEEIFDKIPPGEYYLSILPYGGIQLNDRERVRIRLYSDVPRVWNLIVIFIALFVPFMLLGMRSRSFEAARWSNSSENPYSMSYD